MAQIVKSNGSLTTYSLRRIAGVKCKRKSSFNACVGAHLKGNRYGKTAPGTGGRQDKRIQNAFKEAVQACKSGRSYVGKKDVTAAEARYLKEGKRGG